jgi:hypothetical protein
MIDYPIKSRQPEKVKNNIVDHMLAHYELEIIPYSNHIMGVDMNEWNHTTNTLSLFCINISS